jgi:PTH1 family peptidyl-tRNA hydrolase
MRYLIGLGNPGAKYARTRHNAGYMLVDYLAQHAPAGVKLHKTNCFMNTSGTFVKKLLAQQSKAEPSQLFIAHDDLDIGLGNFKISYAKGPKVHNGIGSIESSLGTDEFWRIRIGVDNRHNQIQAAEPVYQSTQTGEQYVLSAFDPLEIEALHRTFEAIAPALKEALRRD